MNKSNKEIIDKAVEMYFANEDWKGFLKLQAKKNNKELFEILGKVDY